MIPLGTYSTLTAKRQLLQGIYLEDGEGDDRMERIEKLIQRAMNNFNGISRRRKGD